MNPHTKRKTTVSNHFIPRMGEVCPAPPKNKGSNPEIEKIVLTEALIERCRSTRGQYTAATARFLGADFPLTHGWLQRLVGKIIPVADYQDAVSARDGDLGKFQPWFARSPGQRSLGLEL